MSDPRFVLGALLLALPGAAFAQQPSAQYPQPYATAQAPAQQYLSVAAPQAPILGMTPPIQVLVVPMPAPVSYAQTYEWKPPCLWDRLLARLGRSLASRDVPRLVVRQTPVGSSWAVPQGLAMPQSAPPPPPTIYAQPQAQTAPAVPRPSSSEEAALPPAVPKPF